MYGDIVILEETIPMSRAVFNQRNPWSTEAVKFRLKID